MRIGFDENLISIVRSLKYKGGLPYKIAATLKIPETDVFDIFEILRVRHAKASQKTNVEYRGIRRENASEKRPKLAMKNEEIAALYRGRTYDGWDGKR